MITYKNALLLPQFLVSQPTPFPVCTNYALRLLLSLNVSTGVGSTHHHHSALRLSVDWPLGASSNVPHARLAGERAFLSTWVIPEHFSSSRSSSDEHSPVVWKPLSPSYLPERSPLAGFPLAPWTDHPTPWPVTGEASSASLSAIVLHTSEFSLAYEYLPWS